MQERFFQLFSKKVHNKRINPSLTAITKALNELGNPQNTFPSIHITGTNGKGTTAALLMYALQPFQKIGLYTSPHLLCFEERIQINNTFISSKRVQTLFQKIKPLTRKYHLTFFEAMTVMAMMFFAEEKIDLGIIEVGMGGRWDATNVIHPLISIITAIDKDHQEYLGDLPQIIEEKAGIIKPKQIVITLEKNKGKEVFAKKAQTYGNPFYAIPVIQPPEPHLQPFAEQTSLALKTLSLLEQKGYHYDLASWKQFSWPGRLQWITKNILVDGAHNPHGIRWLIQQLKGFKQRKRWKKTSIVFSCSKDKDVQAMLQLLAQEADEILVTDFPFFRSQKKEKIKEIFPQSKIINFKEIPHWLLQQPKENLVIITGSLYFLGTLFHHIIKKQDAFPELSKALRSAFPHHECLEDDQSSFQ